MSDDNPILGRVDSLAVELGIPSIVFPQPLSQAEIEELKPKLQAAIDASGPPVIVAAAGIGLGLCGERFAKIATDLFEQESENRSAPEKNLLRLQYAEAALVWVSELWPRVDFLPPARFPD